MALQTTFVSSSNTPTFVDVEPGLITNMRIVCMLALGQNSVGTKRFFACSRVVTTPKQQLSVNLARKRAMCAVFLFFALAFVVF